MRTAHSDDVASLRETKTRRSDMEHNDTTQGSVQVRVGYLKVFLSVA
jgi:hypothetical protein